MRCLAYLFLLFDLLASCIPPPSSRPTVDHPNIILILADDAGYADFGFMGSEDLETPRIDELAEDGVIFTDAHVSASVCAPSRAGLITGKYQHRFGHECNDIPLDNGLDLQEKTIASALKTKGYQTMVVGKWHLGLGEAYHPNQRGFDEFYGFLAGARSYFPSEKEDQPGHPRAILENQIHRTFDGYLTDVLGDKSVDFIDRNKETPFFLFLSFNAVHTPMHAKEEHLEKYKDHPRQKLAAMTWSMDENIGKVMDKLKQEGIYDKTLIFFLSDNGGASNNQASNLPLKGWKGNKYEGGHRVPFTVTWKDQFEGGVSYDGLTSSLDIMATAIRAAGIEAGISWGLDGTDLLPVLKGERKIEPHFDLYWRKDKMAAARSGEYKLIRLDDYGYRLYNVEADLSETVDVQSSLPNQFTQLKSNLEKWENEMQAPRWLEVEVWNEVTYEIHQALMENRDPKYTNPSEMRVYREGEFGQN
ncbi:MAG: sulfatase-like hydrolase/transferase [Bacteroidota bacterium]